MAQTSDRVSAIAAMRVRLQGQQIAAMTPQQFEELAGDVRALSASALRQDETRGIRGMFRKMLQEMITR